MFKCGCCGGSSRQLPMKPDGEPILVKGTQEFHTDRILRLLHTRRSGEKMNRYPIYRTRTRTVNNIVGHSQFSGKPIFDQQEVTVREVAVEIPLCAACHAEIENGADFSELRATALEQKKYSGVTVIDARTPGVRVNLGNGEKVLVAVDPNEVLDLPVDEGRPLKKRKKQKGTVHPVNKPLDHGVVVKVH